ncbi:GntR family transcriptional regulator [Candidatus Sumerlaeota bacterium]|nr:GntR family transcriptional regulator [Candidatus Sumerlaeota bacterium]
MDIRISLSDGVPVYLQIVNQVKYLVASGRLRPSEQLPPVRKLAETLVINPNTVAKAYRELESAGILTTRRGAGVYVSEEIASPLRRRECKRILSERIDMLLAEARQMNVKTEEVLDLVRERSRRIEPQEGDTRS